MRYLYDKAPTPTGGLRLHLNEHTGGCSPAVIDALRRMTPEAVAFYPDYSDAITAVSERLGVDADCLALTNGLDEGILAASLAAVRWWRAGQPEAIVVVPAFDMQPSCAHAAGARIVEVPLREAFGFPADEVIAVVNEATRIIFLTSPNNPTGISIPVDDIFRIAVNAPEATVFVDEAYADFSAATLLGDPRLNACPNIIVGRTFAKSYGMAGLRCGALVGQPAALAPIRRVLPPYSLNVAAAVALPAALGDRDYYEGYLEQVRESKRLLYAAFEALRVPYWRSDANFVLARIGDAAGAVCDALQARGVYVRDRSHQQGCRGCIRITAGIVSHTRQCVAALEEVLCGVR